MRNLHLRHSVRSCDRREQVPILRKLSFAKSFFKRGSEAEMMLRIYAWPATELFHEL
jgi:hypothetical protein